jgi:hypothetical protein
VNVDQTNGFGTIGNWIVQFFGPSSKVVSAEGSPDVVTAIDSVNNYLYVLGPESLEVFYDNGTSPGDYQRVPGGCCNIGTIAPYSVKNNGSNLLWLGSSGQGHGQVWMTNSLIPQKVSTNAIDHMIESLPRIDDAVGFCYLQEGHDFYMLSFPTGNLTLCYDITAQEWHERCFYNRVTGKNERHKSWVGCFAFGTNFVGDFDSGAICTFDLDTYTDNGEIIRRVRTGGHIHSDRKRLFFREFEIDIERGVGLTGTGQGIDPQGFLSWSDDGGRTWSNEYWGSFGKIGEYLTRMHWHRLGMSRDRVFRFVMSDPVKAIIIDARADVQMAVR